ncbi:MAG: MBL fold metallo-hydrolase [Spirochaetes bacterium]|nr:MBL fold metallo-hydrolase [Spirochaetota bacterium]
MRIEFVGGARTVTGSCYILKDDDFTIMVDCGMFQGKNMIRDRNTLRLIYAPSQIDALLLTHAHIDHSGLIPKLVKDGFTSKIYATKATVDLCRIMLPDSAHIQEMDTEWINKRNRRLGRDTIDPLYTVEDAEKAQENFVPVTYNEIIEINPRIKVRFQDAGHILGAAIIEMWIGKNGEQKKIVFSGDLGQKNQAIIDDPQIIEEADMLLIESTYGNRLHKGQEDTFEEFREIILESHNNKGNIIIPAFAVERTQEIIYVLAKLLKEGKIPPIPVYIDSPLAISATEIFKNNDQFFDKETREILSSGDSPFEFPNLHFTRTTEESKKLEDVKGAIIISASGMCTAGRIKYHLQNNLYKPESSVIFVGFQAEGTTGRKIVDGASRVRLYGEDVVVNARIHTLGGFSAHADKNGLLEWLGNFKSPRLKVFVVHGEEQTALSFSDEVRKKYGFDVHVPVWGEIINLENMRSTVAPYASTDVFTTVDREVEALKASIDTLTAKYTRAKSENRLHDIKKLQTDLNDAREMLAMIIEEF